MILEREIRKGSGIEMLIYAYPPDFEPGGSTVPTHMKKGYRQSELSCVK